MIGQSTEGVFSEKVSDWVLLAVNTFLRPDNNSIKKTFK